MSSIWNRGAGGQSGFGGSGGTGAEPSGFGEGLGSAKARRERRQAGLRLRDGTTVEGTIYILPYSRPMDLVNSREDSFMAVTDATVLEHDGQRWSAAFLAVNKADILFLYEVTNPSQP